MNQLPQRSCPPVPGLLPTPKDLRPEREPVGWRCAQFTKTPGVRLPPNPRTKHEEAEELGPLSTVSANTRI